MSWYIGAVSLVTMSGRPTCGATMESSMPPAESPVLPSTRATLPERGVSAKRSP